MAVREDIWHTLHDAIGWQESLIDSYRHMKDAPEYTEAVARRDRYKKILKRRYGTDRTALDAKLKDAVSVNAIMGEPKL